MLSDWTSAVFDNLVAAMGTPIPLVFNLLLVLFGTYFALQVGVRQVCLSVRELT